LTPNLQGQVARGSPTTPEFPAPRNVSFVHGCSGFHGRFEASVDVTDARCFDDLYGIFCTGASLGGIRISHRKRDPKTFLPGLQAAPFVAPPEGGGAAPFDRQILSIGRHFQASAKKQLKATKNQLTSVQKRGKIYPHWLSRHQVAKVAEGFPCKCTIARFPEPPKGGFLPRAGTAAGLPSDSFCRALLEKTREAESGKEKGEKSGREA
jgi:hypothetical protein